MVKVEDFKTCKQSSFCQLLRDVKKNNNTIHSLELLNESIQHQESIGLFTAKLRYQTTLYLLSLFTLTNTSRITITPISPTNPNIYSEQYSIQSIPSAIPYSFEKASENELRLLTRENYSINLQFVPFKLTISLNDTIVFAFNNNQLFQYHPFANTPEPQQLTFNGKSDSLPHGQASISFDTAFPGSNNVYGLPEHATDFSLKSTRGSNAAYDEPYRLYNLDVFEYILDSPMALYGSIPFMLSHKAGFSTGVYFANSAEMWVDIEKNKESFKIANIFKKPEISTTAHWMAESGVLDLFVFLGTEPSQIYDSFTKLTGRPALPQLFALGYHQCRWNYNDQRDVEEVDAKFDEYDIPYDVLWLDIEHTDSKKYFTWDEGKFPDPVKMQNNLASRGRKMVTIIDPHIKKDDSFDVYKTAKDANLFVKDVKNADFEGWCWPGHSHWLDYTNPAARELWAKKFLDYPGSTKDLYTWNDMNEPSVFTGPEITMNKDSLHHGNVEHRDVHNVYGMLQQRSTYEGHLMRSEHNDRPFILSRAFFAGTQRYGAIWTGDNMAQWDHLEASVPMILSIGIAGVTFAGADVGGFFGNPEPDLLLRWYQVGAFQPFFRGHAHIDTTRREPWLFGEPYTSLIRNAIRTRYELLPYIYTLFEESSENGMPIMRPMMTEFSHDEQTFSMGDQFLLGPAIVVKPVVKKNQASVNIYLPRAKWYDYETLKYAIVPSSGILNVATPLAKIPVFLRGGYIIPRRQRARRAATLMLKDPFTLVVALDENEKSFGKIYLDDGKSFDYKKGDFVHSEFVFDGKTLSGSASDASLEVISSIGNRVERVIITGFKREIKSAKYENSELEFTQSNSGHGHYMIVIKDPKVWVGKSWRIDIE